MSNNVTNERFVKSSADHNWEMFESDDRFIFYHVVGAERQPVKTPADNIVSTGYLKLADRILHDLDCFGFEYHSPDSILSWHFTMIDSFSRKTLEEAQQTINQYFVQNNDWTTGIKQSDYSWTSVFGEKNERKVMIINWIKQCSHMQLTAVCCIGNAYSSINIAFVLASIMEKWKGKERNQRFQALAIMLDRCIPFASISEMLDVFHTFELYYGIHLDEDGPIIETLSDCKTIFGDYIWETVSEETFVGRNYFSFHDGKKIIEQPYMLKIVDFELNLDSDEEKTEDEDNQLADLLPVDCWVKRLCACEDGYEAYYIIAVTTDEADRIENIVVLLEEVQRTSNVLLLMPSNESGGIRSYTVLDTVPDYVEYELNNLVKGKTIPKDFSFFGKCLPQKFIDAVDSNATEGAAEYSFSLQSSYRLAYMHVSFFTDKSGQIDGLAYETYQSSGVSSDDLFLRPILCRDREEEAVDALLSVYELYSDAEIEAGYQDARALPYWRQNGQVRCKDWAEAKCRMNACGIKHEDCPIMLQHEATAIVTREPDNAAKIYEKALSLAPDYAKCWDGLASSYQFMGDLDKAYEAQKKACELSPSCLTYGSIVRILYLSKRFEEARSYLEKLKEYSVQVYSTEKKRLEEAESTAKKQDNGQL